jgi:predicted neuraminidase
MTPFSLKLYLASIVLGYAVVDAQQPASIKPLIDPSVLALADGKTRPSPHLSGVEEAYLPVLYPSSHAANLLVLHNGDILCVWFSGTWEGDSEVAIVISRFDHAKHQWSATKKIDSHTGESYQNPTIFEEGDGTLHLYHTTQPAQGAENNSRVLTLTSKDHGTTWTEPVTLFNKPGAYTRHPMVILPDGRWLLPLTYVTSKGIGEGAETNFSAMELSKDHGVTWQECLVQKSQARVQPTVVQTAPDHLVSMFRSRASDFIYQSESSDGCTWSVPVATVLPNNNASVQMTRLKSGHLAVVFDNSSHIASNPESGLRKPLTIAISEDGGKTWPYARDIETGRPGYGSAEGKPKTPGREEYSYPTVTQTVDGRIHVAFTFRRQTIKDVSFQEDWVRAGKTEGQYQPTHESQFRR